MCTYTFLRLLHFFCAHTPDHDFLSLANRTSDRVSGSSKVALHTPFIALTFYVLTLQIISVLSLCLSLTLTTLQSVTHGWCFNLGLSLTKRVSPERVTKPFIVKFDVYNIIQTTVQFKR